MRKKVLEVLPHPEPTAAMIRTAKADRCVPQQDWTATVSYRTRMYYAAREHDGILIVSAWSRPVLAEGGAKPNFVTYIDTQNLKWISRTCAGGWTRAKIDSIAGSYGIPNTSWRALDIDDPEGLELCKRILGTEETTIERAVLEWQDGIREKECRKAAENKKMHWDLMMSLIPPVPDDFEEWADKEGTGGDHFLFYRRKAGTRRDIRELYCTRCGGTSEGAFMVRHSPGDPQKWDYGRNAQHFKCPRCGALLTTKAWGKQKEFWTWDYVILPQAVEGGRVVLRQFRVRKAFVRKTDCLTLRDEWGYSLCMKETSRVFVDPRTFVSTESYAERETRHFGSTWAQTRTYDWGKNIKNAESDFRGVMYARNAEEIAEASGLPAWVVRTCAKKMDNTISPQARLRRICEKRYIEYLYRSGLTKLAEEIIEKSWGGDVINEEAKDLKTLLGLDGQQLRLMKEINGTMLTIGNIECARGRGEKVDADTLSYMDRERIDVKSLPLDRTGMSLQRTMNYIRKQARAEGRSFQSLLRTYKDYLDMAEERGMDLRDEIVCRTPRLRELHDRYAEEAAAQKANSRDAQVDEKFRNIKKDCGVNEKHFHYNREGLVIIVPGKASDITAEGRLQHHCVGATDTYISKMDSRSTYILFLRHEEDEKKPYYTLEVGYDGKVIQAYGAYDRKPDREKVDAFLAAFTKEIKKRTKREKAEERAAVRATV